MTQLPPLILRNLYGMGARYGTRTPTANQQTLIASCGARWGRSANAFADQFGTIGPGFWPCVPFVVPWPWSTDDNGVAYPSGLLGLRTRYVPTYDDTTPQVTSIFNELPSNNNNYLMAVPSVLPSGYTLRSARDHAIVDPTWNGLAFGSSPQGGICSGAYQMGPTGSPYPPSCHQYPTFTSGSIVYPQFFRRDTTQVWPYDWTPDNIGQSCFGNVFGGGSTAGPVANVTITGPLATPTLWFSGKVTGIRYLRLQQTAGSIAAFGGGHFELVVNANGSNAQPGDTVIWTSGAMATSGTTPYDSGVVFLNWGPSTNARVYMGWRFVSTFSGGYSANSANLMMGPRLDIPAPFTACGLDALGNHIIAPGGV